MKIINSLLELPCEWFYPQPKIFVNQVEADQFVKDFTDKFGEPTEAYQWNATDRKIYIYLRNDSFKKLGEK
jgi:hypothetical protein